MKTVQKTLEVKVIKQVPVEVCTFEFFKDGSFPKKYCIVKISKECYGIAKLNKRECRILFKHIAKIDNKLYLLSLEDDSKMLIKFWDNEEKISFSHKFKKIIKVFNDSILVEDLVGNRQLVGWKWGSIFFPTPYMSTWTNDEKSNNMVVCTPDNRRLILLKKGLKIIDKGYRNVMCYVDDVEINNKFRIVDFEDESMAIIRIYDLKQSEHFKKVDYIRYVNKSTCSKSYLEVTLYNDRKAIIRISDFKISKSYNNIIYLSSQFALVKDGVTSNILRLSDFAEAKWPEDQES